MSLLIEGADMAIGISDGRIAASSGAFERRLRSDRTPKSGRDLSMRMIICTATIMAGWACRPMRTPMLGPPTFRCAMRRGLR